MCIFSTASEVSWHFNLSIINSLRLLTLDLIVHLEYLRGVPCYRRATDWQKVARAASLLQATKNKEMGRDMMQFRSLILALLL